MKLKHLLLPAVAVLLSLNAHAANKPNDPTKESSMDTQMIIRRAGSQPSQKGPAEYFTGSVRIDPLFPAQEGSQVSGALVTFEPGARSAWHTHPLGQNLVVISGMGWTQCEGGPKKEIRAGDVVSCPCGKKHWHGATDTTAMSHIAIQEAQNGSPVTWMEKVTDEQYSSPVEP